MSFVRKHFDFVLILGILFFIGILPNIRFINNYYIFLANNGTSSEMYLIEIWGYMFYMSSGAVLLQLFAPLLITIMCIRSFYSKISSGYILNEIQFRGYKPTIIREIFHIYLKSLIPLFGYSVILVIISFFIHTKTGFDSTVSFMGIDSPLFHIITVHLNMIIFSLSIANIALVTTIFVKRFILSVLLTQGLFVTINIILYIISSIISRIVDITNLDSYIYLYNLYALDGNVSYLGMIIIGLIFYLITLIIVISKLWNKERLVDLIG